MSKSSKRHVSIGKDPKHIQQKIADRKERNRQLNHSRYTENLATLSDLGLQPRSIESVNRRGKLKYESPSKTLRRYRRLRDGITQTQAGESNAID